MSNSSFNLCLVELIRARGLSLSLSKIMTVFRLSFLTDIKSSTASSALSWSSAVKWLQLTQAHDVLANSLDIFCLKDLLPKLHCSLVKYQKLYNQGHYRYLTVV